MQKKQPSFLGSITIVVMIFIVLGVCILHYGLSPQIPIVTVSIIVAVYGLLLRNPWKEIEKSIVNGIVSGLPSVLILSLVGMLIGVWILNGTVPTLTVYFLSILSPTFFLVLTVIITAVTAIMTGSSVSAMGTVGVALMGAAAGLDIPVAAAAGAIVSGALFGDKLSPLSDTTNLASSTAEVDIFEHVRHMLWTTIPSLIITLILFMFLGIHFTNGNDISGNVPTLIATLNKEFLITPWTLLSPLFILFLAIKRVNPIPSLILGLIVAVIIAFFTVPGVSVERIMNVAQTGYTAHTGSEEINTLLSRGGLMSMMNGVSIIILALGFGGIIQEVGVVRSIVEGMGRFLTKKGNVIMTTILSSVGVNALIGEQYTSIVLPGKLLNRAYDNLDLKRINLSRTLEDGGTLTHVLFPWGVLGAIIMSTLGVDASYIPFTFLCFINPIVAVIYGYTGLFVPKRNHTASMQSE